MKLFLSIILLLSVRFSAEANTYYVNSTGDDNNSGLTEALAWKSITKVNTFSFAAGDIISFQGGSTFAGSIYNTALGNGVPGSPITLTSYGTGKAIINSGMEEGILVTNGNITITNLIFTGSGYKTSGLYTAGVDFYIDSTATANCDNILIDNVECYGYGNWGILMNTVSASYGYNHVRVTNCLLHDNGYGGFQINGYADPVTLSIVFSNTDIYVGYTKAYNNFGRLDYTLNWTGSGILISGTINGLIEYCEAYNNGKENGSTNAGPVGIFLGDSKYVNIEHCISHHNLGGPGKRDGGGFDLDQGSYGCVIEYCESYENEGAGYGLYQAATINPWSNDTVRYNTSTNDGRNSGIYGAITFWGANGSYKVTNAQIYNNQINMNVAGYALIFLNNNLANIQLSSNSFCLELPSSYFNYRSSYIFQNSVVITNSIFPCSVQPAAIMPVTYRGAFAPSPNVMWTAGWTNYDPQNANYPTADSIIETSITSNTTLSGLKTYLLRGSIYVKNGATINIEAGCVIRADKAIPNSSLIITRGSKIIAAGMSSRPIVFTSNQAAGSRNKGDWGGIIILGNALYNGASGQGYIAGIAENADSQFGGGINSNDDDNSGTLEYVRIEFAGYTSAQNQEKSGLVLGAVGDHTTIDHIQVSYSNDDGFGWFGGSVNCKYLVSYRNLDDNWDTNNGYNGAVQFSLGIRDPNVAQSETNSKSEGFESDNNETGSNATPFTNALFCNMTEIGPLRGKSASAIANGYGSNVHIRNNSHLRVLNSILMDFPTGVFIDGESTTAMASGNFISTSANKSPGNIVFRNNVLAGNQAGKVLEKNIEWDMAKWFDTNKNDSLVSTNNILIDPYKTSGNAFIGDYRPMTGSVAITNYNWNDSAFYRFDSIGNKVNLIVCPITTPAPVGITGSVNTCSYLQSGDTAMYYLSAKNNFGILKYNWTVPAGISIQSGQGTDTIVVKYTKSFTGGSISAKNLTYCGVLSSAKSLALQYSPPNPLGNDTTVYFICSNETINLVSLYNASGFVTAEWNTATPEAAPAGNYQFMVSNTSGCKDTAAVFVKQDIAVWKGTLSRNWHNASNWSGGHIPTEKTHVIITGATPNICEVSDMDAVAASVQAKSSGSISLTNNRKLIINANCSPLPSGL